MNILLISDVFPPGCGGSGWSTFFLARSLKEAGHSVHVITLQPGRKDLVEDEFEGVSVTRCGIPIYSSPVSRKLGRRRFLSRFSSQINKATQSRSVNVIHAAHMLSAKASVQVCEERGLPFVITVRDYWPVCLYSTMLAGEEPCSGCSAERIRSCFENYNKSFHYLSPLISPSLKTEMQSRRELLQKADRAVFVSNFVSDIVRRDIPGIKSEVIFNGMDLDYIKRVLEEPPSVSVKKPYILFVGKLERSKGSGTIMRLLANPEFAIPIVIVGEGEDRSEMIRVAEENRKRTVFLNWQGNNEVLKLMTGANMLIFPSFWNEPLSRVLLEAISVGLPVVAMNTGGTSDIIEHEKNGLLLKNEESFVREVMALALDLHTLKDFSKVGKQIARQKFDQKKMTLKWINLYDELIRQKKT